MAGLLPSGARRFGALLLGNGIITGSALGNLMSQVIWDQDVQVVDGKIERVEKMNLRFGLD